MKKILLCMALCLTCLGMQAQQSEAYEEAPNPTATNPALWSNVDCTPDWMSS